MIKRSGQWGIVGIILLGLWLPWQGVRATPCGPLDKTPTPNTAPHPRGYVGITNPATGQYLLGEADDPLAAFSRRPLDEYIIPEGGLFLDPLRDEPHYGIDYANPADYLNSQPTYIYPIGPGYVTTRADCVACFVDGNYMGSVEERWPEYNFGWGGLIVVETPYNARLSIYVMYAHLGRDFVALGDYVTPDEPIAVVGNTGYSEEMHLHMEIRYGPPGRFWNADFSEWETLNRWLATMFMNPAWLIYQDHHESCVRALDEFIGLAPKAEKLP